MHTAVLSRKDKEGSRLKRRQLVNISIIIIITIITNTGLISMINCK